jgi:hypothetical protein
MRSISRLIIVVACLALGTAAHAQTYQNLGNGVVIGSDGSMSQRLGNTTIITPPVPLPPLDEKPIPLPQPTVICQPLGNTTVCN